MYILKKFWYIQPSAYRDPYLPSHGPFVHLETLGKLLDVVPHLGIDIGTLGTSLRKLGASLRNFGTSNHRAIETLIFLPMVHLILWGPLISDWRSFSTSE